MNLPLTTAEVYVLEGLVAPAPFFRALKHIMGEGDRLVFGIYESPFPIISFLRNHSLKPNAYVSSWKNTFLPYPHAGAYSIPASPDLLQDFAELLSQNAAKPAFNHVMGFKKSKPCFEFHDSFLGGTLYISNLVSPESIELFSKELNVASFKAPNPYLKWGLECKD